MSAGNQNFTVIYSISTEFIFVLDENYIVFVQEIYLQFWEIKLQLLSNQFPNFKTFQHSNFPVFFRQFSKFSKTHHSTFSKCHVQSYDYNSHSTNLSQQILPKKLWFTKPLVTVHFRRPVISKFCYQYHQPCHFPAVLNFLPLSSCIRHFRMFQARHFTRETADPFYMLLLTYISALVPGKTLAKNVLRLTNHFQISISCSRKISTKQS